MGVSKNEKKDAICPFYSKETNKKIFCHGINKQTAVQLSFKTLSAFIKHRRINCCSYDYLKCPIASMLWKVWDNIAE